MSIANLLVQPDAAYIVTDSGFFGPDGRLLGTAPKSIVLPDVPIALACVGSGNTLIDVFRLNPWAKSSDGFSLDAFRDFVRGIHEGARLDQDAHYSRWVAAYYSRNLGRPLGFTMFTHAKDGEASGREPWTWYPARTVIMPMVPPSEVWGADIKRNLPDPSQFNPHTDFMDFVHAQRRHKFDAFDCAVAGEILLTKVNADGVADFALHDFGGVVGKLAGD